jgi:hypothetical protein
VIQVVIAGAIAVFGLLWVAWPRQELLVPGTLFLDERVAARLGLSNDAWSRVRRAGGGSGARDITEARLVGVAFAVIGISALVTRMPAMLALVPAVVVLYSVVLWSATSHSMGARAVRARGKRGARFILNDVASVAMLGPIGNTVILVCVPSLAARCLAVLVGAVLVVVAAVFAATAPDDAASPLERAVAARRACGLSYTAISAANILALAYGTLVLDVGSEYGVILLGWSAVSMALLAYHARARFEALNETLQSAAR